MKYIILFLISFNLYASFDVNVINNKTGDTFRGNFKNMGEANKWVNEQLDDGSWGKRSDISFEILDITVNEQAEQARKDRIEALKGKIKNDTSDDAELKEFIKLKLIQGEL